MVYQRGFVYGDLKVINYEENTGCNSYGACNDDFRLLNGAFGKSIFRENYSVYVQRVTSISMKLMEIEYGSGECDWDDLDADLKTARDSLDAIEKLSPPPIYSAQHQNLCEEMKAEKVWCDAVAKVAEDKEMNDDNLKGVTDAGNASNFNSVAIRLITQMKRDGVGTE